MYLVTLSGNISVMRRLAGRWLLMIANNSQNGGSRMKNKLSSN